MLEGRTGPLQFATAPMQNAESQLGFERPPIGQFFHYRQKHGVFKRGVNASYWACGGIVLPFSSVSPHRPDQCFLQTTFLEFSSACLMIETACAMLGM